MTAPSFITVQPPPPMQFRQPGEWPKWARRFERYRHVSGLSQRDQENQVHALLYALGSEAEDIFDSFQLPAAQTSEYETVMKRFEQYFIPQRNVIYERAKFNKRSQQKIETVDAYVTDLFKLAEHCEFGQLKEELIRDRLVVGIQDLQLSEKLQLNAKLTLQDAIAKARNSETVKQQQAFIQGRDSKTEIDAVQSQAPSSGSQKKHGRHSNATTAHRAKQQSYAGSSSENCQWCGRQDTHQRENCPASGKICKTCNKKGHFAVMCKSTTQKKQYPNKNKDKQKSVLEEVTLGEVSSDKPDPPWIIDIVMKGEKISFKVDTGADVTAIPAACYRKAKQGPLLPTDKILVTPARHKLNTVGKFTTVIKFQNMETMQTIYVVQDLKQGLLGRPAIRALGLISELNTITAKQVDSNKFKTQYPKLFKGLGCIKGHDFKIALKQGAIPQAVAVPRRVPIPILPKIKRELAVMEQQGVIEKITDPTEWCAPMVMANKPDGGIRICGDFTNLNKWIIRERFVLPTVDENLAKLQGSSIFTKLDANKGFFQIPVEEESRNYLVFITPFGRYRYKRMPMGVSSAPEHFQAVMSQMLDHIPTVSCQVDDILIGGTQDTHSKKVHQVLQRLEDKGVTLNEKKCEFSKHRVKFLGHILSNEGIKVDPSKTTAISNMSPPKDVNETRSFLGMVTHLGKFIPDLASKTHPLRELLGKNSMWTWGPPQQKSFDDIREILTKTPTLTYYDPNKPQIVSSDASSYGLGAVLLQEEEGSRKPVAYASRALTPTEQRYATIEKEALGVTWACDRFRSYLMGIQFHIETDHKPLIPLLSTKRADELPPRLQRYRLRLQQYTYSISHIAGKEMYTADVLSRKPVETPEENYLKMDEFETLRINHIPGSTDFINRIREVQKQDYVCAQVRKYCEEGWPSKSETLQMFRPYNEVSSELTVVQDILMRNERIVIPEKLQHEILQRLHEGHQGISKTRARARDTVWWPACSQQIADFVTSCHVCTQHRASPTEPMIQTDLPDRPWQVVGTDLCMYDGKTYLVTIDYYSRFFELELLTTTTSAAVIKKMKASFARFGIPDIVRSDNGPQYASQEFEQFATDWGFNHITSSPYYPRGNAEAERAVQTAKNILKKNQDIERGLMAYRDSPVRGGYSPAELLLSRSIKTTVPKQPKQLMPKLPDSQALRQDDDRAKAKDKKNFDRRHRVRSVSPIPIGTAVWIHGKSNVQGTVSHTPASPAERSYRVRHETGVVRRNRTDVIPIPQTKPGTVPQQNTGAQVHYPKGPPPQVPNDTSARQTETVTRSGRVVHPPQKWGFEL